MGELLFVPIGGDGEMSVLPRFRRPDGAGTVVAFTTEERLTRVLGGHPHTRLAAPALHRLAAGMGRAVTIDPVLVARRPGASLAV